MYNDVEIIIVQEADGPQVLRVYDATVGETNRSPIRPQSPKDRAIPAHTTAGAPADSVAADALDALAIEGTRAALVPLAPAPDAGALELPLPALLFEPLALERLFDPLFLYDFQTFSPLMYTKRPEASPDPVRRATKFLIASRWDSPSISDPEYGT